MRWLTALVQLRISNRGKIASALRQVQFPRRNHLAMETVVVILAVGGLHEAAVRHLQWYGFPLHQCHVFSMPLTAGRVFSYFLQLLG